MPAIAHQPRTLPDRTRRKALLWLSTPVVVAAAGIVLALSPTGPDAEDRGATAIPEQEAPGHRLGGSPELGTSGIAPAPSAGPIRRDGGPEKGTRGPAPSSASR
jgi:hypothetical protein